MWRNKTNYAVSDFDVVEKVVKRVFVKRMVENIEMRHTHTHTRFEKTMQKQQDSPQAQPAEACITKPAIEVSYSCGIHLAGTEVVHSNINSDAKHGTHIDDRNTHDCSVERDDTHNTPAFGAAP